MTEIEAVCGAGAPGVEERSFESHEVRFEVLEGGSRSASTVSRASWPPAAR